jgi:hypothetical protein
MYTASIFAEPNGAVLYRNGKRLGYHKVSPTAEHHYFGYLEGPAWENKYSAFRFYIDKDDRNALDLTGKYKGDATLQFFSDTAVDEHKDWPWGSDILSIGSSMGLGSFRLFVNNNWVVPQLPENIDSLVVTILDSSVQTPKIKIGYYGWNVANDGNKINAIWTLSTSYNERPTHCELSISGTYSGKVVVGMVNHKENTSNPNRSSITVLQEKDNPLLATLGKQCDITEGYSDTLLMAIIAEKSYFDSFASQGTTNLGMVLKPDADKKVKWSFVYSWAKEENPLFRSSNWKEQIRGTTGIISVPEKHTNSQLHAYSDKTSERPQFFTLTGKSLGTGALPENQRGQGLFLVRQNSGTMIRFNLNSR